MQYIENKTFDELRVGDSAELTRTLRQHDIELFDAMAGDADDAAQPGAGHPPDSRKPVADGMWGGALISALIGTELPGPGTIYLDQSLRFHQPACLGDRVIVRATVRAKDPQTQQVTLECVCRNAAGELLIDGEARVRAPAQKVRRPRALMPDVHVHERGARYDQLIAATQAFAPLETAVVHPCDELSIAGAIEAMRKQLIRPVLVGPPHKIRAAAERAGYALDGVAIVDAPHSHAAAAQAVALAREGKVRALMKGALHTDELMAEVTHSASGLRTERRISHVFALDVPTYPKPLFITDAAINIQPNLGDKRDIVQNAVELAHALGIPLPKVAILSAVETISPKIPSTVEAAALCKMLDRGQITGAVLDGPLAFDTAVSAAAAASKELVSPVAGHADILVVPDLESGNMLAKQLIYLAGADAAGIVLGARVPIMLTSRSDSVLARLASSAIAKLLVQHRDGARR